MRSATVIDAGLGNIGSVLNAIHFLGADAEVASAPEGIANATRIILPGVGAFSSGMKALKSRGLDSAIREAALEEKVPILGICLGMQLMATTGTEGGETTGLGLVEHLVHPFSRKEVNGQKIPHVGFDSVNFEKEEGLFSDLKSPASFYFTHSHRILSGQSPGDGTCHYGVDFVAAFQYDNICGTQCHPEKSQSNGLRLLKNFMEL